jgi:LmbE family N-acetylglucosaminyl deacetylase
MRNLKITIRALSILLPVLLFQCNTTNKEASINKEEIGSVEGKTVMAIFAHPDDEMTVAPILSKYAREGAKVYLVICTDGRYGTNDFSGIEAGEGLVAIRKEEMKCAANNLGVELIHLNYHDQLKSGEGYDGHVPHAQALLTELYEIVTDKKPDALITWGPDGGTTHMDHRLVGASVTQVFVSRLWEKPTELFYVGTPSKLIDSLGDKILRGVDDKYLNTRIKYTKEDSEKALASLKCHKSQMSPQGLIRITEYQKKFGMEMYLRQFIAPKNIKNSIFN